MVEYNHVKIGYTHSMDHDGKKYTFLDVTPEERSSGFVMSSFPLKVIERETKVLEFHASFLERWRIGALYFSTNLQQARELVTCLKKWLDGGFLGDGGIKPIEGLVLKDRDKKIMFYSEEYDEFVLEEFGEEINKFFGSMDVKRARSLVNYMVGWIKRARDGGDRYEMSPSRTWTEFTSDGGERENV